MTARLTAEQRAEWTTWLDNRHPDDKLQVTHRIAMALLADLADAEAENERNLTADIACQEAADARIADLEVAQRVQAKVIQDLRQKLAIAGVEGSPPPGEDTTIGALTSRARDAETKLKHHLAECAIRAGTIQALKNEIEHHIAFRADLTEACRQQRVRAQDAEAELHAAQMLVTQRAMLERQSIETLIQERDALAARVLALEGALHAIWQDTLSHEECQRIASKAVCG